jgi:hypothetical protein
MRVFIALFSMFCCSKDIVSMEAESSHLPAREISHNLLAPSMLGRVYRDLSNEHLVGRWLSPPETKKVKRIINRYDLNSLFKVVRPFELDMLFQVGIALELAGYRDIAADMILFAHQNGYSDNFVIESLKGEIINKERIVRVLEDLNL